MTPAVDALRATLAAPHPLDECVWGTLDGLRAVVAEYDAVAARLGAVRECIGSWRHGEDCPAGDHEDCDPAEDGGEGCHHGNTAEECDARKAICECGVDALWSHVRDEPASDARTLGEAQAKAEKFRRDAAYWQARAQEAHPLRAENMRLTRELAVEQAETKRARGERDLMMGRLAAERDAALAHAEELTRALRAAQAIVEGRTVAPTPAEAHAHNVATGRRGWWLVTTDAGTGLFALDGVDGRIIYARRSSDAPWVAVDNGSDTRWHVKRAVPLDAEGRPCACPVAPEVPA